MNHVYRVGFFFGLTLLLGCFGPSDGATIEESQFGFAVGPDMLPGENCLRCHSKGSQYSTAPVWTAAGTVFERADSDVGVAGAEVHLTDATGQELTLTTNAVGNFYTAQALTFPLRATLTHESFAADMPIDVPAGSCNACHSHPDPSGDAKGSIRIEDVGE